RSKNIGRYGSYIIFFFQAEDGIRVFHVTGVQTCALPILPPIHARPVCPGRPGGGRSHAQRDSNRSAPGRQVEGAAEDRPGGHAEIGRESCRERVETAVGAMAVSSTGLLVGDLTLRAQ